MDSRYLNDTSETSVIKDLLLPIFELETAKIVPALISKGWLRKEYLEKYGLSGNRLNAEAMYKSIVRAVNNVTPFFIVSFCKHEIGTQAFECGLLSQWRGYAGGGGFAIEFDEENLDHLLALENNAFPYAVIKTEEVRYDNFDAVFDPKIFEGAAGEMIRRLFDLEKIDVSEVSSVY